MIKLGKLESKRKTLKEIREGFMEWHMHVASSIKKFNNT